MPPKPATGTPKTGAARTGKSPASARPTAGSKSGTSTPKAAKASGTKAAAKDDAKAEGGMSSEEQDRLIRNSIDHETKIRDQIQALTGKVISMHTLYD
jgi:hypothetical protein